MTFECDHDFLQKKNPRAQGLRVVKSDYPSTTKVKAAGKNVRSTRLVQKEKADHVSMIGLYFMPATTYSPTHFRVQYHRPSGA
jgi:hypothetical protein